MDRDVILIHGMWCTGANWARVRGQLEAAGLRCHAPNLPHHQVGKVDPAVGAMSLRDYRKFLLQYVRGLKLKQPPILMGHSMGGLLAQQIAADIQPAALVLLAPAPQAGINGLRTSNLLAFAKAFARPAFWRRPHIPSPARAASSAFNGVPPERHRALYAGLVHESGAAAAEIGFWFVDPSGAARVDTRKITCPVYVVSAGRDRLTPASVVRKVAAKHDGATLRHYPGRGHWVIDDGDTDEMIQDLLQWLRKKLPAASQKRSQRA